MNNQPNPNQKLPDPAKKKQPNRKKGAKSTPKQQPKNTMSTNVPPQQVELLLARIRKLEAAASNDDDKLLFQYLISLMCGNFQNGSKVPDSFTKPTYLYHSQQTVKVFARFSATPDKDDGKFALVVQPKMGDVADVSHYKTAVSNGTWVREGSATATNWASPTVYAGAGANDDPRLDDEWTTFLLPSAGQWLLDSVAGMTAALPLGTAPVVDPSTMNLFTRFDPVLSRLTIPEGMYRITLLATGSALPPWIVTAHNGAVIESVQATIVNNVTNFSVWTATVTAPQSTSVNPPQLELRLTGATSVADAQIYMNAIAKNNSTISLDGGPMASVRPAYMNALFTPTLPSLSNAGIVVGALMSGEALTSEVFTSQTNVVGMPQNWERLADFPYARRFRLEKGGYGIWLPSDQGDLTFRKPSDANKYTYPFLMFAGQYQPLTPPVGDVQIGVMTVCTGFEMETEHKAFRPTRFVGSTEILDRAKKYMVDLDLIYENPFHWKAIGDFLKKAGSTLKGGWNTANGYAKSIGIDLNSLVKTVSKDLLEVGASALL